MNGNISQSNDINCIDLINGQNSLDSAVNEVLASGISNDIDLNGFQIVNTTQYSNLNAYPNNSLPDVAWCKAYLVSQGQPGQLAPLNDINQALPLTGTLDLTQNSQQTLVNNCPVATGSKQAVNAGTLYGVQQTLQTNINTVQTNLNNETSRATTAEATLQTNINNEASARTTEDNNLQTQITTLQNRTLDQVPVPTSTVNMNNQALNNLLSINASGTPYFVLDSANNQMIAKRPIVEVGTFPSTPGNNQLVTLAEVQAAIQATSVSNMVQPQVSGSSSRTVAIIDSNKLLQNPAEPVAFQSDLSVYATTADLNTEITNRTNADSSLQTQITNEVNARTSADTTLQNNINTTNTNLTTLSNDLSTNYYNITQSNNAYMAITTDLSDISNLNATSGAVDLNDNLIINLADPINDQDAATKLYVDNAVSGGFLPSNSTLNSIASTNLTSASVNMNSNKLVNLVAGSQAGDSVEYNQLGSAISTALTPYSTTTQMNSAISSALLPYSTTSQADAKYYLNTTPLNNITLATSSISANNQKITNLSTPTLPTDAVTKAYADAIQTGLPANSTLNSIANTNPTSGNVSVNGNKITSLADPTLAQDASTKNYVDTGLATKYNTTTTLDAITAPTSALSLNSQKIVNLADPTLAQDAVTLNYLQTNNYTKTQSDANFMPITRTLSQIQQFNPITTNLDLYTGTTAKVYIPTITDTISSGYDKQALNLDYYNSLQKIVEHIYLTTATLPTSNANTTGWAIQQQQTSTANLIVFSANQITLKANNTFKIILRAQSITANNNNANAVYQIQTSAGSPLVSTNSSTLSLSPATSNLQTNLGGNIEILYTPVTDTTIRCFCTNLSGVLSVNLDWHVQLMPTSYSVAVSPSLVNTQVFSQIYTTFTNNANFQILHNLALPLDQLAVQVYIRFKANTAGWTTSDWLQVWALDRIALSTDCGGFQLTTDSSNPNNAFLICFANNGQGVISKVGQNYTNYNTVNFDVKVVCSSIGTYVVSQQAFASSALSVNSNIDFLNAYKIVNLPTPVSSGDALTKGYLDGQNYQTQTSADARYYQQTVRLNGILAPNGTLNMNSQKITGLALATASTDAVSKVQLDNFTPTSIYASDLSTNIICATNTINSLGAFKMVSGGLNNGGFNFIFNSNSSSVSTPSITANCLINDQISQTGATQSRWALAVQSTINNTSPSVGSNASAAIFFGITSVSQRAGSGQTTSSDLLFVEGICKANQFVQWTPSRQQFKRQIKNYEPDPQFLNLVPITFKYDPDSEYVQRKSIGCDKQMYGFLYEDVQQNCPNSEQLYLDENQLNLTQIKDEMLFTLWNENKTLKSRLATLESQMALIMQTLSGA